MRNTSARRARGVVVGVLAIVAALGSCAAGAQSAPPPTVDKSIDERGVDLITGDYYAPWPSIAIGQAGVGGLVYSLAENSLLHDTLFGALNSSGSDFILTYMGVSSRWTKSGSSFLPADGQGGALTFSSTTNQYTYRTPDGATVIIDKHYNQSTPTLANEGRVTSVMHPDGQVLTYTYGTDSDCVAWHPFTGACVAWLNVIRVMAISSSLGYRIKYEYESADFEGSTGNEWLFPTRVLAINTAVDDCSASALTCTALTENWPSLSFSNQAPAVYAGTITDNMGREYVYTATAGVLTGIKFPGSSSNDITVSYTNGRVSTLTMAGETWTYAFSDDGSTRTTTVTDPGGHEATTISDLDTLRVATHTNKAGEVTSYQYDSLKRLTRITQPESDYVQYTYDGRGNVTEIRRVAKPSSGLSDIVVTLAYPATCSSPNNPVTCNRPTAITDPRGKVTNFTYNATHGGVTKIERPSVTAGRPTTTYAYTSLSAFSGSVWRPTTIRVCATAATCANSVNETETTITYKADSRVPSQVKVRAGDESGTISITNMTYNHNDDVVTVDGPQTGTGDTVYLRYDDLRRQVGSIGPDPDGAGALKRRAFRVTFNDRGLPTASERGTVTGTSDAAWTAFVSLLKQTMAYDSHGRLTKTTLVSGGTTHSVTQYNYDTEGRPQCVAVRMNPGVFGSLPGACTLSTAGTFGSDRITKTFYDSADRVNKVTTALGTVVAADETQDYTPNGLVSWVEDGKGNRSTYVYDGFDRLAQLRYPHATNIGTSSTTDYDGYTYDSASNVTQQRFRDGQTVTYTFDNLNRVTLRNAPGSSNDQAFTYDLLGRVLSVAISGHTNSFTYNAFNQVTSAASPLGTLSYLYDAGGNRTRVTHPDGFYVVYDYDVAGGMTKVRENGATSGAGLLAVYSYDDLGRRTSITRGNGVTTTYAYEPNARLDVLSQNLAGSTNDQTLTFSYNPSGQIASRTASNDAYAWTDHANMDLLTSANGRNQITTQGGVNFTHDARGNMTSDGTVTYGYDADNRLTSAAGAILKYDAVGRLFEVIPSGLAATRFLSDGPNPIGEYNTSGTLLRRYVHGAAADEPLVWYEGSGTSDRRWLVSDERGSIIAATDSSGNPVAVNSYDEYGTPDADNIGRFQYTGQAWINTLALYYYKSRFYDPALGRFLQTDRIGYQSGLNLYAYVGNEPVNRIDPTGTTDLEIIYVTGQRDTSLGCGRSGELCSAAAAAAAAAAAQAAHEAAVVGQTGATSDGTSGASTQDLQQVVDEIVVTARRTRQLAGIKINFRLRYPLEQLWIVTDTGNIIYVPIKAETYTDSCGNTLGRNIPDGSVAIPNIEDIFALIHTHPSWGYAWPAAGDYTSAQTFSVYNINSKSAWVLREGAARGSAPVVLSGSPPSPPPSGRGATCQ